MIQDKGTELYDRASIHGYEECQGDILAVSGMTEDIRDALLEYQVGGETSNTTVALLTPGLFSRRRSSGRYTTRIAG